MYVNVLVVLFCDFLDPHILIKSLMGLFVVVEVFCSVGKDFY